MAGGSGGGRVAGTQFGMKLFVAGISYKTAPVALREKVAVRPAELPCHACRLKLGANLDEVVLLSTCNRVEIYGTTPWVNGNVHSILRHLGAGDVMKDLDGVLKLIVERVANPLHHPADGSPPRSGEDL